MDQLLRIFSTILIAIILVFQTGCKDNPAENGKNNPPAVSNNPVPADSATGVYTSPTLSWSCSDPDGNTLTYNIFFGTICFRTYSVEVLV